MVSLRLRPTKKVLIILGIAALASLGLSYFVLKAQARQRAEWEAKLAAKMKEAEELESAALQLPDSEAALQDLQYRVSFLRGADEEEYQPALLTEMTELAWRTGVEISGFNPVEGAPTAQSPVAKTTTASKLAPHRFITLNLSLQGSFHNVTRFLYRLTGVSKVISVDGLQVVPAPEGPADHVRVTAQATAYVLKNVPQATAMAAAKLQEIAEAEEKFKAQTQGFGTLEELRAAGLSELKEGETIGGYTFTTDKKTSRSTYKILATSKDPKLHSLSIDKSKKITDETDKVPYD